MLALYYALKACAHCREMLQRLACSRCWHQHGTCTLKHGGSERNQRRHRQLLDLDEIGDEGCGQRSERRRVVLSFGCESKHEAHSMSVGITGIGSSTQAAGSPPEPRGGRVLSGLGRFSRPVSRAVATAKAASCDVANEPRLPRSIPHLSLPRTCFLALQRVHVLVATFRLRL